MGAYGMSNCGCCECNPPSAYRGPDLGDYTVLDTMNVGDGCVVLIHYHQCDNYGGRKILVYLKPWEEIAGGRMDPHFCENCESPFARFEPTMKGFQAAALVLRNTKRYCNYDRD